MLPFLKKINGILSNHGRQNQVRRNKKKMKTFYAA